MFIYYAYTFYTAGTALLKRNTFLDYRAGLARSHTGLAQCRGKPVQLWLTDVLPLHPDSASDSLLTMESTSFIEANEKDQFIEIWLSHLKVSSFFYLNLIPRMPNNSTKSSTKSSCSSLHSKTSSVSSAARSSAKAIRRGIKRIKKGANTIVRPLKRAKHALSNVSTVSSSVISGEEDDGPATNDEASMKSNESPEVIAVGSDEELDDLEKELGACGSYFFLAISLIQFTAAAKETWRSPIYSFFKPAVTIEFHNGRVAHFFTCSSKKCKTEARGVRRYQDKGDKSSTANLRHHAIRCFGEDSVNEAVKGESGGRRSGNIFSAFASQGQRPLTYSHRAHSTPEFR